MLQLIPGFPATNRTAVNLKTERQFIMTTAPANTSRSILAMLDVEQFVQIKNDQVVTNSLKVAEAFGKQHRHILRSLKNIECSDEFTESNFGLSDYIDSTGRVLPMYEMTKDGFMFLVMGFTGAKAAAIKEAYIRVFNEMAAALEDERAERVARSFVLGDFTGEGVALDFGRGQVFAEHCDRGNLWLADWEIDSLLGYKMPNATQLLFFRNKTSFPDKSFEILEDEKGGLCVMFTPTAWAVIARHSQSPRADKLLIAAVTHHVTPGKIEVDKQDYLNMAEYTLEARDRLRRLAGDSRQFYDEMQQVRDVGEDSVVCLDQSALKMSPDRLK